MKGTHFSGGHNKSSVSDPCIQVTCCIANEGYVIEKMGNCKHTSFATPVWTSM